MAILLSLVMIWCLTAVHGTLVKPRFYEIRSVNSSCTSKEIKIRLELNRIFNGVVYAKGFPLEKNCRSSGIGETFVDISIGTSGCGVRLVSLNEETLNFRVNLNVQMDKFLQQITDLEVSAACNISSNEMTYPKAIANRQLSRTGRNKMSKWESVNQNHNDEINRIKTWMEIEGTSESSGNSNKVSVGEQTMMVIKSFLPEKVAATVTDCYANDGTRDVIQKLLDENGCPLDETIMPSLELIKYQGDEEKNQISWDAGSDPNTGGNPSKTDQVFGSIEKSENALTLQKGRREWPIAFGKRESAVGKDARMRLQVMGTTFSAFKFPDTSNLHLRCTLLICREACPEVTCESDAEDSQDRMGKSMKSAKNYSSIIDKIEVFNSVEVLAPGIDMDGFSNDRDGVDSRMKTEGNSFCLSASKMAFSFAILGAVFLCGVLAALWTVMRSHLRKANKIDGSEQILVVRDSPMNFTNARNKTYLNWSYS